jgi:hypothetical protein
MSGKSRTDARFPYEYRQIVVVSLPLFLLWEQEVPRFKSVRPDFVTASLIVASTMRLFVRLLAITRLVARFAALCLHGRRRE